MEPVAARRGEIFGGRTVEPMRSYYQKPAEVDRTWYLVDAADMVLGRLAVQLANLVRGKHKPTYTPWVDDGDRVVVINAAKIRLSGQKEKQSLFFWHTGYPGGLKSVTKGEMLGGKFPERVLVAAVRRMIPRGPLGRVQLGNLMVYPGKEHPHQAQRPKLLDLAGRNPKNLRR